MTKSWRGARLAAFILICAFAIAGCKTSDDATAAAAQMSATAKCLSDYYTAVGKILSDSDQIKVLNAQLYAKPYPDADRAQAKKNEGELAKRAALAADFSQFSGQFAKLAGSTAPADVAASADSLRAEIETLEPVQSTPVEQEALKSALTLIVTAVKERKEREAAKAISSFAKGLTDLFKKESPIWKSEERVHTALASNLATQLVDDKYTDSSAMLKVGLDPFGLTPFVASPDLTTKLSPLVKQQITARGQSLDDAYDKSTDAMTKSLEEMSKRIDLVANDKPMSFRAPPLTLATVEQWATKIASL